MSAKPLSAPAGPSGSPPERAFEQQFPGGSASANDAVRAIAETFDVITRFANEAMRQHGLSPAARQALATIEGAGGTLSQTEIATRLLTKPPSITSLIDTLERRGLVTRTRDSHDRRRQVVTITADGAAMVRVFEPEAVALQTAVMSGLDEADRQGLIRALEVIRATTATLDGDAIVANTSGRGRPRPGRTRTRTART